MTVLGGKMKHLVFAVVVLLAVAVPVQANGWTAGQAGGEGVSLAIQPGWTQAAAGRPYDASPPSPAKGKGKTARKTAPTRG